MSAPAPGGPGDTGEPSKGPHASAGGPGGAGAEAGGGARGGPAAAAPGAAAAADAPPADSDAASPEPPQRQPQQPCGVCSEQPPKYRCPGCGVRSCSAACVARHKADTGCTGKRDRLAFVPLGDFGDRELLSDYRWLEEVQRADDNAKRHRPPAPKPQLPQALSSLVHQARLRGVRLLIMPPGMQRRRESTTFYNFRARRLLWRVEWCFPEADPVAAATAAAAAAAAGDDGGARQHRQPLRWAPQPAPWPGQRRGGGEGGGSAGGGGDGGGGSSNGADGAEGGSGGGRGFVLVDERADENATLRSLLEAHLRSAPGSGARRLALRSYVAAMEAAGGDVGALPVLMRQENRPANDPRYDVIDANAPLRTALAGKTVIEFPTLVVGLPGQAGGPRYPLGDGGPAVAAAAGGAAPLPAGAAAGDEGLPPPPAQPQPQGLPPPPAQGAGGGADGSGSSGDGGGGGGGGSPPGPAAPAAAVAGGAGAGAVPLPPPPPLPAPECVR
ncbi:hypothetical protein Rsub_08796 [Raphidocelis subcapitata]|uniref:HIT-type domain-containing protein n=1 Tax=Raphidocelis subcapitata TaxID=307507 RepID=A0A2V0P8Q9_9CHLO|nr:hypothetical protein Rsub_08796 [Raphidocelis subcapitata]|eukprot:GBF96251.1 hypothetical protein Rsub_08796 [Raphidocelis subcapitata]